MENRHGGRWKWVLAEPFGRCVTFNDDLYHPISPEHRPKANGGKRFKFWEVDPHCHYCEKKLSFEESTLDHKVPRSKGGSNSRDNLVLSCFDCNQAKADQDYDEYVASKPSVILEKQPGSKVM